jgi:hypothetical protein
MARIAKAKKQRAPAQRANSTNKIKATLAECIGCKATDLGDNDPITDHIVGPHSLHRPNHDLHQYFFLAR